MSFRPYVEHGWKLCPIREGEKRPRGEAWNSANRALNEVQADHTPAAGLMHAYSGTCAFDLDDIDLARAYLADRGIDLLELLQAPDSVHISSGTANRGKLLYALPEPLPTKRVVQDRTTTLFELRCGAKGGTSTQDLLPPSPHPSGRHYEWAYGSPRTGSWRSLPPIPPKLLALWHELLGPRTAAPAAPAAEPDAEADPALLAQAQAMLAQLDPDCDYDTWLHMGMALDHDLGNTGWELWNAWSAKGTKYPGEGQLQTHWNSFGNYNGPPVTLGTFKREFKSTVADFDDVGAADEFDDPFDAEVKAQASKLKLWTLDEIQQQPWPEWIIRGVLPMAELSMVYGPSGIGKSFVVLDMALAIARGVDWNGCDVRPGGVLWIAAEAFGSMKPRTKAYAQAHEVKPAAIPDFRVLEGFSLSDADQVAALCEAAKQLPQQQLIVVDTLAAASAGVEENNSEMNAVLGACRKLHYATRASVLLIHHSGKDAEKGARGWSGIRAAMQAELRIDFNEELGQKVITSTKQRDGADGKHWGFELCEVVVGEDDREMPITSAYVKLHGEVDTAPKVQGDGQGKRPPSGHNERVLWREYCEMRPLSGGPVSRAVLLDKVTRATSSADGMPRQRAALERALIALDSRNYLRLDGEMIRDVEAEQEGADDGSDLV